jgi:hypothetical protein
LVCRTQPDTGISDLGRTEVITRAYLFVNEFIHFPGEASAHCCHAQKTISSGANSATSVHLNFLQERPSVLSPSGGILRWREVHMHKSNVSTQLRVRSNVPRLFGPSTQWTISSFASRLEIGAESTRTILALDAIKMNMRVDIGMG